MDVPVYIFPGKHSDQMTEAVSDIDDGRNKSVNKITTHPPITNQVPFVLYTFQSKVSFVPILLYSELCLHVSHYRLSCSFCNRTPHPPITFSLYRSQSSFKKGTVGSLIPCFAKWSHC